MFLTLKYNTKQTPKKSIFSKKISVKNYPRSIRYGPYLMMKGVYQRISLEPSVLLMLAFVKYLLDLEYFVLWYTWIILSHVRWARLVSNFRTHFLQFQSEVLAELALVWIHFLSVVSIMRVELILTFFSLETSRKSAKNAVFYQRASYHLTA